ncbi:reverse transcriptase domain-containing protein, partial [Shigella flexneri]|nr:reverse transcriptase domain-containing protein [Shigella flexneri]
MQELLKNYHRNSRPPRCAIKVDILKAYDTVDWDFILHALSAFNFPASLVSWIRCCITSPMFSISINGELAGFFPSNRGLRQGDPL